MSEPADYAASALPPPRSAGRSQVLRITLFLAVLGGVLTAVYSLFLANYDPLGETLGLPATAFHQVIVPLLALAAVTGALIVERQPLFGMLLLLGAALLASSAGGVYLAPAAVLACYWAQRHHSGARMALGFILLIPGVVTVYYGLAALLVLATGQSMPGMPPSLDPPASLRGALLPFALLPAALLGAWLLADRPPADAKAGGSGVLP